MHSPAGESHLEEGRPRRRSWRRGRRPRGADSGFSLIEIVVSITLLGIVSSSILASLGASTAGSARHRELSTATAWLQSAADALEIVPVVNCVNGNPVTAYQEELRDDPAIPVNPADPNDAFVGNSDNWDSTFIAVSSVKYWNGSAFGATCYDDIQLVALRVVSPNGKITQTLDVVKSNPYTELKDLPTDVDAYSNCTMLSWAWSAKKPDVLSTSGGVTTVKLKKPSLTKQSSAIDGHITVTLKVSGTCSGKLRMFYEWPHMNKNGTLKHYHRRTINLKLVKGTTDTYVGKLGHHGDKYFANQTIDISVQQGRAKSKTWTTILSGQQDDKVVFA